MINIFLMEFLIVSCQRYFSASLRGGATKQLSALSEAISRPKGVTDLTAGNHLAIKQIASLPLAMTNRHFVR